MSMITIAVVSLLILTIRPPSTSISAWLDFNSGGDDGLSTGDDGRRSVRERSTRPVGYSTQKVVSLPYSTGAGTFGRLTMSIMGVS